MPPPKTLSVITRQEWRSWLENHFSTEKEIWLVFPKKSSGKHRLLYNDAVEEALCFGWIDSTVRKLDETNTMQRFTPRNPKSSFSQSNKERLAWLLKEGKLHPTMVRIAQKVLKEPFIFPPDIIKALRNDPVVWKNYQRFSPSYQRIRIAYIDDARNRPVEFKKRLNNFIKKTKENKRIGYGGIEKYY
ncbi:MAG TPA: YdeI/OmpD-associated family protein [Candidatus Thermoplasmatota archaeon]|nr:YdeI/OmpD-associated family protein [Candidatus Thermoplasmatota archaeon]